MKTLRVIQTTKATKSKLITKSTFSGYDFCLNSYVGCTFGCKYCYVRFFVKDPNKEWGDFVRTRDHIVTKLPKELKKVKDIRLVLGTMTDPYMGIEKSAFLTQTVLKEIIKHPGSCSKVGIFTRSPLILRDLDLIKQLPKARVHYTISPYPDRITKLLEPTAIPLETRLEVIQKIKEAGIRVHTNIAPTLPLYSEPVIDRIIDSMYDIGISEFFVDPMQTYKESFDAVKSGMQTDKDWADCEAIMSDKLKYDKWKKGFEDKISALVKANMWKAPDLLPIISDHEKKRRWIDARTMQSMDNWNYGDDLV